MPRPEVNLIPERTALVIVECQGGTVGADSALPDLAAAAAPALPVIGRLARLPPWPVPDRARRRRRAGRV